jgi:hypothetical protein
MQPPSPAKARDAIACRWFLGAPIDAEVALSPRTATTAQSQSQHRGLSMGGGSGGGGGGAVTTPATPRAETSPNRRPPGVSALQLPRGSTAGSVLRSPGGPASRSPGRSPGATRRTPRVDPVWGPSASLCSFGAHFI